MDFMPTYAATDTYTSILETYAVVLVMWLTATFLYEILEYTGQHGPFNWAVKCAVVASAILFYLIKDIESHHPAFPQIVRSLLSMAAFVASVVVVYISRNDILRVTEPTVRSISNGTVRAASVTVRTVRGAYRSLFERPPSVPQTHSNRPRRSSSPPPSP